MRGVLAETSCRQPVLIPRLFAILFVSLCNAADGAELNWKEAAETDLAAGKATLLSNTPGAVSGVDADFLNTIEVAYSLASKDAARTTDYAGYRASLERFVNVFQDDHLWVDFKDPPKRQWPGFLPGYRNGHFVVTSTSSQSLQLAHAQIVSCDNVQMSRLARREIQTYVGRWSVASARRQFAPYLFVDIGNPFVRRPARCTFLRDGKTWTQELGWEPIAPGDLAPVLRSAQNIAPQPSGGVRVAMDGGYWIGIPTLSALNPQAIGSLEGLMKAIEGSANEIRSAKYFVIDLRGNSGGNTFVALRVLNAIWGEGVIDSVRPRNLRAQWRASPENLQYLDGVMPILTRLFGATAPAVTGLSQITSGFTQAIARQEPLYVDPDEYSILDGQSEGGKYPVMAQPFLLTDGACVSSCLNLVDLMLSLPHVRQVGDETGADTYYLENRPAPLPTGHAVLQIPIKLYSNRTRQKNASHEPSAKWSGDMGDTEGIEAWIAGIANASR
jgi:hypothetical protein